MVMVGTFPVRWTEGEVVDVVWDGNGHGIRGGVSADDYYFWIGIGYLCRIRSVNGSLLLRLQISPMWMSKVDQIR